MTLRKAVGTVKWKRKREVSLSDELTLEEVMEFS
jgi:hypothetical protein